MFWWRLWLGAELGFGTGGVWVVWFVVLVVGLWVMCVGFICGGGGFLTFYVSCGVGIIYCLWVGCA